MCKQADQIRADLQNFQATGELPPAWEPEVDAEFDARVDEMNREIEQEREAIESGSVEPPRFGWSLPIRNEAGRIVNWGRVTK